jgi:hypothetical protein
VQVFWLSEWHPSHPIFCGWLELPRLRLCCSQAIRFPSLWILFFFFVERNYPKCTKRQKMSASLFNCPP